MIYELNSDYFVRGLVESDVEGAYPRWFQDQEICKYSSNGKFPKTLEYFRRYVSESNCEDRVVWAICHRTEGHIGNLTLQNIANVNRNAEFAIMIGNKSHWGRGVALLAGRALLRHGFFKLNLERVYCGTAVTNTGMCQLAERLGMTREGQRRKALFLDGSWSDVIEFGILREEFRERV